MSDIDGFSRRARGLSEVAIQDAYGCEEQCRAALFEWRCWGWGWRCRSCGHGGNCYLRKRGKLQCNCCKHQVSVTAGTIFYSTKLPLKVCFLTIYYISQSKGGISSAALGRRLGVRDATAWLMKHKIMAAMHTHDDAKPKKLKGRIERDDAYLGGAHSGGKRRRGAAGKTPFIAAVETTIERRPWRINLKTVKGFRKNEVQRLAKAEIELRSSAVSEGRSCWSAVTIAEIDHFSLRTGSGGEAVQWAPFKWVTVLGTIKMAITGVYHRVSAMHAERYLAKFVDRFSRRYDLDTITQRLAWTCAQNGPHTYRIIVVG
jgi:hypothetical protein